MPLLSLIVSASEAVLVPVAVAWQLLVFRLLSGSAVHGQPARKHALCITDIAFPTVPCYLPVRMQCDICYDVIIVFQHGSKRPRWLLAAGILF